MNIPFFRYQHLFAPKRNEILSAMTEVMDRGSFILQAELKEFEQNIAQFVKTKEAIGVGNGTDSIFMACKVAGIKPGDEVIMASHTYIATAAAVHFTGASPILVDCGSDNLIDPECIENAITERTKCIIPTQLNGRTCNMRAIKNIAKKHNLLIIEDAAQALGSKYDGQFAGTFGIAGSISLYPAKLLGCFGDGGLLFTNDEAFGLKLRQFRDHGRNEEGLVTTWGVNSRLDNLQAAICNIKLRYYNSEIKRRREIANQYDKRLKDLDDLVLPPGPNDDSLHFDCYQNYEIQAGRRDELRDYLKTKGIGTIIQWAGKPVHHFAGLGLPKFHLPVTDALFKKCFLLPMNTSLTTDEVDYICDSIIEFYEN